MESKQKFRSAAFEVRAEGEGDAQKQRVHLSFSSEAPCPMTVFDDETGEWVSALEVLGHGEGEIDFTRMADGLVVQDTHNGDQIGLIREVKVEDGKLCGDVDFCCGARAKEIEQDALAGLRRNMSVGYMVEHWSRTEEVVDGLPVYRADRWMPFEASFVNTPADVKVGVNRAKACDAENNAASAADNKEATMAEPEKTDTAEANAVAEKLEALTAKVAALEETLAKPAEEKEKPEMPEEKTHKALFDAGDAQKIVRNYDIMKAVRALAGVRGVDAGFEREISDEIAKKTGRAAQGFFVPEMALRAFDKATYGGNLVATDTLFNEMVPALVAETVLGKAGARTLTGLVGDVEIPKAGSATAYWVSAEGGDTTESTPTIGQITATPKTVGAYTDITRKLMNQSGISAQAFVTDALRSALARAIETAAFSGSGSSGQPTGLDNASISTISNFTTPTLAKVLEFISTIEGDNAMGANMKFIGRPSVWAKLGSTLDWTAVTASDSNVGGVTSGKYLLDTATNTCQGYDFLKANLATANKLYFGDWSKLLLAFWSGLDLTVDTNSLSKSGGVRLVALQDMDVIVTQPKAFASGALA